MICSIIMSTYNSESTVSESIESMLNQSFTDFEFLIMDDCSEDKTSRILKSFSDKRIKLFQNKKNLGLTKSLNFLISQSNGKYIARQDADDFSLPMRLEKQIDKLENSKYEVCVSRAYIKNNNRIIPKFNVPYSLIYRYKNPFIHGTLVISKKTLIKHGMYNERFKFAQDYKLFKDLIEKKEKIYVFKEPFYILNMQDNISTNYKIEQKRYFDIARKK